MSPRTIEKLLEKEAGEILEGKMPLLTARVERQRLNCLHPAKILYKGQVLLSESGLPPHSVWVSVVCLGTVVQIVSSCF